MGIYCLALLRSNSWSAVIGVIVRDCWRDGDGVEWRRGCGGLIRDTAGVEQWWNDAVGEGVRLCRGREC